MNHITTNIRFGTIGELLVQLRLLEFGVQAAAPIKDSGNDLIAIRGEEFRAIQVKTRLAEPFPLGKLPELFHIVALVQLVASEDGVLLDRSKVFLLPREVVARQPIRTFQGLDEFVISARLVDSLFS